MSGHYCGIYIGVDNETSDEELVGSPGTHNPNNHLCKLLLGAGVDVVCTVAVSCT